MLRTPVMWLAGLILGLCLANERRRYFVTLVGRKPRIPGGVNIICERVYGGICIKYVLPFGNIIYFILIQYIPRNMHKSRVC